MKINIVKDSGIESGGMGTECFEWYYAYKQSFDKQSNFSTDIEIQFNDKILDDYINVLYFWYPESIKNNLDDFDLIFVDNNGEALEVCDPFMHDLIMSRDNAYFMCGGIVEPDNPLYHKIIPYNHNINLFKNLHIQNHYPHCHDLQRRSDNTNRKNFKFINGQDRSYRHYFQTLLRKHCKFVDLHNYQPDKLPTVTPDCQFETVRDTEFRDFVNTLYDLEKKSNFEFSETFTNCGIDGAFGNVSIVHIVLDDYFQYKCVIFPESTWINDEFFATEKIFKCFVAGALPFPIAGSNVHAMYNKHGFYTALNLCPPEYLEFDKEKNHCTRYNNMVKCLQWLNENVDVFESDLAKNMIEQNKNNFLQGSINQKTVLTLDKIFKGAQ